MDLAASGAVAGLVVATVVETGAGCVPCHLTMMAQFIFMTASFSLEGRPRIAGPGVSEMYQYEFTLWGRVPGQSGCQVVGPWSAPYRGIWDSIVGGESGTDMIQASGQASWADLIWIKVLKHMEG